MTLDLFTVTVMTAIVASVASITYILETIFRRDAGPGRLWAVAFFCGLSAAIAYMAWSSGVGGFVSVAVGNSLFVLCPGSSGSGRAASTIGRSAGRSCSWSSSRWRASPPR